MALHDTYRYALGLGFAATTSAALAYWIDPTVGLKFGLACAIAYAARFALILWYRSASPPEAAIRVWLRWHTALAIAAGLAWGSAPVLMAALPSWQAYPASAAVFAVCFAIAAASSLVQTYHIPAADGFIWAVDLSCAGVCLWIVEPAAPVPALVFLLGAAGSSFIARCRRASLAQTLRNSHAYQAMSQELEQSNRDLSRVKADIEASSKAKSAFLASMSHELRTPLNAIIGFAEVMSNELLGPIGMSRYRDYAGDIYMSGQHLLGLINDVLDLSKIEAGELRLNCKTVDLEALMQECARLLSDRAARAGILVVFSCETAHPFIQADASRIRQIGFNLLSNAIKFTPTKGLVSICIMERGDENLVLAVTDTGIGIKPEDIPLALTPFRQVESATSMSREGTGLGLPLTKILAEAHGGSLAITSTLGQGTTVQVVLPRSALTAATAA